ncbi:hypothetical protein ANACAC_03067 [Anaerostipes caccae L1-92]|uniref:Uncharacterized protein n=1 Tax=Anaerostipes caccae (strain DSM 14662 / CCUG 47493 / JCM 13470 / NCIMB 13811 / L1-92) TaxID=411490 RepID=B0MHV4_ANACD|nr:hypothetical protein ANACAC_03067 [Anaerostipes caccae L1-92]
MLPPEEESRDVLLDRLYSVDIFILLAVGLEKCFLLQSKNISAPLLPFRH